MMLPISLQSKRIARAALPLFSIAARRRRSIVSTAAVREQSGVTADLLAAKDGPQPAPILEKASRAPRHRILRAGFAGSGARVRPGASCRSCRTRERGVSVLSLTRFRGGWQWLAAHRLSISRA